MGNTNTLPVVSQIKSGVQLITGDVDGALATQEKFFHECPVVAQATSLVELVATGDEKKFVETNERSGKLLLNTMDGIPVVGHAKAGIHLLAGDKKGAEQAYLSATRSTGVVGGGVVGFVTGGPVGAVAGGNGGGALVDGSFTTADSIGSGEFKPHGTLAAVTHAVKNPSGGAIFDAVAVPVFDGVAGYGAGQITAKIQNGIARSQLAKSVAKRDAAMTALEEGMEGGMSSGQALLEGKNINGMTSKITALEGKLGMGKPVFNPKTGLVEAPAASIPKGTTTGCTTTGTVTVQQEEELLDRLKELERVIVQRKELTKGQYEELCQWMEQLAPAQFTEVCLQLIKDSSSSSQTAQKIRDKTMVSISVVCGMASQLLDYMGFIWFLVLDRPDVILFNEVKATERVLAALTTTLGYRYMQDSRCYLMKSLFSNVPSTNPMGRFKRGSAILYKPRNKFTVGNCGAEDLLVRDGAPEVEVVFADFKLKSGESYRLVSMYSLKDSTDHFKTCVEALKKMKSPSHPTIVAGDFNMKKDSFRSKWASEGWMDCLRPGWATNITQGRVLTEIDYVMTSPNTKSDLLVHKPFRPTGSNVHCPIAFTVGDGINRGGQPCIQFWGVSCSRPGQT